MRTVKKNLGLRAQLVLSWLFTPITYGLSEFIMRFIMRYRWKDFRAVRQKFKKLIGNDKRPLIICPNHLTMIDSLLIIWAMTPFHTALSKPGLFPWNTPEKTNFAHIGPLRFVAYISKCIELVRLGTRKQTSLLMDRLQTLLSWGQSIMIFPEGARSNGRIDGENYAYGVGKLISEARNLGQNPRVLLVYLRGRAQKGKSSIPRRGENFYLDAEIIEPSCETKGLRASRDLSTQLIRGLQSLEEQYLELR